MDSFRELLNYTLSAISFTVSLPIVKMRSKNPRGGQRGNRGGIRERERTQNAGESQTMLPVQRRPRTSQAPRLTCKEKFGIGHLMRTAKFQADEKRQQSSLAEENMYCQDPPDIKDLIEERNSSPNVSFHQLTITRQDLSSQAIILFLRNSTTRSHSTTFENSTKYGLHGLMRRQLFSK